MAVYTDREAFIPYRRADLVDLCIEDGQLAPQQAREFRRFCEILSAYYHFKFHAFVKTLKQNYIPFDPNEDQQLRHPPTPQQQQEMGTQLLRAFQTILESANYQPLPDRLLREAFEEVSLVNLKTDVDFDDFERVLCCYRGDSLKTLIFKRFFRKKRRTVNIFERVALLIQFKGEEHFRAKKANLKRLRFVPGKMYVYLYKNVPKFDIELLFPNVRTSMTWADRLLFGIPAVGAAIPLVGRVAPQLLLVIGIVLFFLGMPSFVEWLAVTEEQARSVLPILVASMSLAIALGGFALKQYTSYQAKKIRFQKKVTDTLFFRNVANNRGVFQLLTDAAEEEECKEIILVYYHLLTSEKRLTVKQLDNQVEAWMEKKFGVKIDFDIQGPLRNLSVIRGKVYPHQGGELDSVPSQSDSASSSVPTQELSESSGRALSDGAHETEVDAPDPDPDPFSSIWSSPSKQSPLERSPLERSPLERSQPEAAQPPVTQSEGRSPLSSLSTPSSDPLTSHPSPWPSDGVMCSLFSYDTQGYCSVLPLRQAQAVLDYVWDHAFTYANGGADPDA